MGASAGFAGAALKFVPVRGAACGMHNNQLIAISSDFAMRSPSGVIT